MNLPLFRMLDPAEELTLSGELVGEGPHEKAEGAHQRWYEIAEGHVIITMWPRQAARGHLPDTRRRRELFAHYGEGHEFDEVLDDGFGKTYRWADMERYALWSYVMDYTTFGTMEFHPVKWG
jgi:hypothetical protein